MVVGISDSPSYLRIQQDTNRFVVELFDLDLFIGTMGLPDALHITGRVCGSP